MADPETPDPDLADEDERMEDQSDGDEDVGDMDHQHSRTQQMHNATQNGASTGASEYSVFSNPPNLALFRQRLFDLEEPFQLSPTDFDAYFPFVDNVWRKLRTGDNVVGESNQTVEWYCCRLRKGNNHKAQTPRPTPEGKQSRRKRIKDEKTCDMTLKVVHNDGPVKSVTVIRGVSKDERHTHDLDYMDGQKRNSAIMDTARREAARGFLPTSIFWKMWQEPEKMVEAGGKFMKTSDVRNVQYAWRQENQDLVLQAHPGYQQTRSTTKALPSTPLPIPPPKSSSPIPKRALSPPPQVRPQSQSAAAVRPHLPPGTLQYPDHARTFLQPYLPNHTTTKTQKRAHITLTWASSLDGRIAIMPGVPEAISGPETKAMTHYLRSQHDAILIGVRTAIADDPGLNSRLAGVGGYGGEGLSYQPRPIIIDPHARLIIRPDMKMLKLVNEGRARAPWVVVSPAARLHPTAVSILKNHGGEYLMINDYQMQSGGFNWEGIFTVLFREGIRSIMIEGGGVVLSELLKPRYGSLLDSVILTIAPTFFGKTGVPVSQDPTYDDHGKPIATRLQDVRWQAMGEADVVLCGHIKEEQATNGMLSGIEELAQSVPPEGTASRSPTASRSGPISK